MVTSNPIPSPANGPAAGNKQFLRGYQAFQVQRVKDVIKIVKRFKAKVARRLG